MRTDSEGKATAIAAIPPSAAGVTLWLHALDPQSRRFTDALTLTVG